MAGKKKHRLRKQLIQKDPAEDGPSSDENLQLDLSKKVCSHLVKAVNMQAIRKIFKDNVDITKCRLCPVKAEPGNSEDNSEVPLWLCLQCGHIGCGRYSDQQHAIAHYKTPRSDSHALCISLSTWSIWCYDCDDDVLLDSSKKLIDCVDLLKRNVKQTPTINGATLTLPAINQPLIDEVNTTPTNSIADETSRLPTAKSKENSQKLRKGSDILESLPKVKGLNNLGNTCFFNSVMQSLSQTHLLAQLLDLEYNKKSLVIAGSRGPEFKDVDLEPLSINVDCGGPLNQALTSFLKETNSMGRSSRTLNPGQLFGQVCKKAPQFRGMMQQDSHELLRHLLDGLKSEETKRCQAGILKAFNLTEKVVPKLVDDATRSKVKAYGRLAPPTLVDQIFSGQLISTVLCEECKMSSQVFEPFLDLSLPVMEEKPLRPGAAKKSAVENEDNVGCFGKTVEKPSKYQEKKAKKQAKRDAKVQRNKAKQQRRRTISLTGATTDGQSDIAELPVADGESKSVVETDADSTKNSVDTKDTPDLSDADVEDNAETESICSVNTNAPAIVGGKQLENEIDCNASVVDCKREPEDVLPFRDLESAGVVEELCLDVHGLKLRQDSLPTENGLLDNSVKTRRATKDSKVCSGDSVVENGHAADTRNGIVDEMWGSSEEEGNSSASTQFTAQSWNLKKEWVLKSSMTLAPPYQVASRECSVLSCLNQFTAHELLTGNNKFGCENCRKMRDEERDDKASLSESEKKETIYTNASKQLLVFCPPAILTLHLKRFQQVGFRLQKVNRHVDFPLTLDLAPYCSLVCLGFPTMSKGQRQVLYSLYAVVEHSGQLSGGHYTAYVKVRPQTIESKRFVNDRLTGECNIGALMEQVYAKLPTNDDDADVDVSTNDSGDAVGRWYHVSDGHVSESSEAAVLKCQAYLLFYERIA